MKSLSQRTMRWCMGATLLGLYASLSACSSEPIGGVSPSGVESPDGTSNGVDPTKPGSSGGPDDSGELDDSEPPSLLDDPADDGAGSDEPDDDPDDAPVTPDDGAPTPVPTTPVIPSNPGQHVDAPEAYFPPRIRRLTSAEFEASVQGLLGNMTVTQPEFVPDARQSGFARNEGQIVDPLFARQLQQKANALAAEYVSTQLSSALPCAAAGDAACATTFFGEFLPRAFRRAVSAEEVAALVDGVYAVGAEGGGFAAGIQLALSAALQSAAFVYHTELGDSSDGSATTLSADETAAQLAYLFTGAPPDAELVAAAADGRLATAEGRAEQARRLLTLPAARAQVVALIEQWLGIDALAAMGKDNQLFQDFENGLRDSMLAETESFVTEVAFNQGGSLATLLGADFTVANDTMRQFYGAGSAGGDRLSLAGTGRLGILNQAAFLARYASEIESSPIKRGVSVARRVMCIMIADPGELNIDVVPPQPDPNASVRERFERHSSDPQCQACHAGIDAIGFAFEDFDAVGRKKQQDQDTTAQVPDNWMLDMPEANLTGSDHLAAQLSASNEVKRCFTRNLTRFAGAATDYDVESYFLNTWHTLEASSQDSILEILVAYAASDVFVKRAPGGTQ